MLDAALALPEYIIEFDFSPDMGKVRAENHRTNTQPEICPQRGARTVGFISHRLTTMIFTAWTRAWGEGAGCGRLRSLASPRGSIATIGSIATVG